MHIEFSPVRGTTPLELERQGDVLIVAGIAHDFSPLSEGAILPRDAVPGDWLASDVTRTDGVLHLTVVLPHGVPAPSWTLFPAPVIDPPDGPVPVPPFAMEV